jgi:hypothetical protein
MASTYSDLKIQLMATGENSTTWGTVTNTNLGTAIEEAITGSADVTFSSANVTLTLTNTNSSQTARNLRLNLVGTTGGARDLIVPAIEKVYIVNNGCADTVTIKVTGQTGVAVPAGKTMYVYNNATDCTDAITHLRNLTLATALPPGSGGTGITSAGTAGNVLTSNGSAWASTAPTSAFTSGMILLWSGSIVSIPAGWYLCDGSNSTPDLRDRFIVGAGSTYAVNATGGSANAIVVSHTHTATDSGHTHTITVANQSNVNDSTSGGDLRPQVSSTTLTTATGTANITVASAGSSGTNANLPPYYALAYIMKA